MVRKKKKKRLSFLTISDLFHCLVYVFFFFAPGEGIDSYESIRSATVCLTMAARMALL